MLHRHELASSRLGPRYQFPGSNGPKLPLLEGQTFTRAVAIMHGDWPLELNDYYNQITNFIQVFSSCRRTQSYPERHVAGISKAKT